MEEIKVSGSHYDIGYQIGTRFADEINSMYNNYDFLNNFLLVRFYSDKEGKRVYEEFLKLHRTNFPQYVKELEGLAQGSKRDFHEVFLLNIRGELRSFHSADQGCLDYIVNKPGFIAWGHNEDGDIAAKDTACIVHAHVDGESPWTAVCSPGFLAGNALGYNAQGLVYTVDDVYPNKTGIGLGRHFLARDLLTATNLDEAIGKVTPSRRAIGFNYVIGSIKEKTIIDVEVAPKTFQVLEVDGIHCHTNHYIDQDVDETIHPSSIPRLKRALSLPQPQNLEGILDILTDNDGSYFPIQRTAEEPDDLCNLWSSIVDVLNRKIYIYVNQKQKPELVYTTNI